jgi:hypothetical protein
MAFPERYYRFSVDDREELKQVEILMVVNTKKHSGFHS